MHRRFYAIQSICIVACRASLPAAQAEVCLGTLPLSTAAPEKSAEILANITNVTTLNSQEDLKMGKIIDVDAVDTTLLIAVKYNDAMQVWIWDVYDGFQYGYEI